MLILFWMEADWSCVTDNTEACFFKNYGVSFCSCSPSFLYFCILKPPLQRYQFAKTTERSCEQTIPICGSENIFGSRIFPGCVSQLLIFSGISNKLIWIIFLLCSWCIEINVELLHMFIRSSFKMYIFIPVSVTRPQFEECSVLMSNSWYWCLQTPVHNRRKYLLLIAANYQLYSKSCSSGWDYVCAECGCAAPLDKQRDSPSFPASGIKICPSWGSASSLSREQHREFLIPQFPQGLIGQKRERAPKII